MKKNLGKRIAAFALAMMVSVTVFAAASVESFAYTETTGTVNTDNVKVRQSASTTATQVSSLKSGDTIDIVDEATDASGYVWYKIRVNKSEYGYVRSDLVTKTGSSSSSGSTTTTTTTSNTSESNAAAASLPATEATLTENKSATAVDNCNVRSGAGTAYDSVGKLSKGDSVTITGEATGTDNKTWYQVTSGSEGKTGFVRSDLLNVVETSPAETTEPVGDGEPAEGEVVEGEGSETSETETEETVQNTSVVGDGSYALTYENDTWYLYDYGKEQRVQVEQLISVAEQVPSLNKKVNTYKTAIIVLAVVVAILLIALVVLALKLRESLYYGDEEEEEEFDRYSTSRRRARDDEDEEEEEALPRRPRRTASDEEKTVRPSRNAEERPSRPARSAEERTVRPSRRAAEEDDEPRASRRNSEDRPSRPARRGALEDSYNEERQERTSRRPSRREEEEPAETPKRRAKNFIGDDDDFEFEFLDLDDDK